MSLIRIKNLFAPTFFITIGLSVAGGAESSSAKNCFINGHPAVGSIVPAAGTSVNGDFLPEILKIQLVNPRDRNDVISRDFAFLVKKRDASIPNLSKQVLYSPYVFATQSVDQGKVQLELDRVSGTETNKIEVQLDASGKSIKSVKIRQRLLDSVLARLLPISINDVSCDFSEN